MLSLKYNSAVHSYEMFFHSVMVVMFDMKKRIT